jgi:RNA-binding protein
MLTSKQRAYLKSKAHDLAPVYWVGKQGVTPELVSGVTEALSTRELIKVAVQQNCGDEAKNVADMLSARTKSQTVQVIGKRIVLYKQAKEPVIVLPKAAKNKAIQAFMLMLVMLFSMLHFSVDTNASFVAVEPAATGRVVEIISGDSIMVSVNGRDALIRLLGIDANDNNLAFEYLQKRILGQTVVLHYDSNFPRNTLRWNNMYVYLRGEQINMSMLEAGVAKLNASHTNIELYGRLMSAEDNAQDLFIGVWRRDERYNYYSDRININLANEWTLVNRLVNVSPELADAIIQYRRHNPFSTIEEIKFVPGMTKTIFDLNLFRLSVSTNINTATETELNAISALSDINIERIIEHRDRADFKDIIELRERNLVSAQIYESIRHYISVTNVERIFHRIPAVFVGLQNASQVRLQEIGLSQQNARRVVEMRAFGYRYKTLGELMYLPNTSITVQDINRIADNVYILGMANINHMSQSDIRAILELSNLKSDKLAELLYESKPYLEMEKLGRALVNYVGVSNADTDFVLTLFAVNDVEASMVNINTATRAEIRAFADEASTNALVSAQGRMTSPDRIPLTVSRTAELSPHFSLYTNINTASDKELASLDPAITEDIVRRIRGYRAWQPFGSRAEVEDFFEDNGLHWVWDRVGRFIVVR